MPVRRIVTVYLFKEILTPFILTTVALAFILLMDKILRLTELVVSKGVAVGVVTKLFLYLFPSLLIYIIPVAVLLSVLIAFGRLSSDQEIIALKASGVSLYQLLPPVAMFALVTFILSGAMSLYLVPMGNTSFKNLLFQITRSKASLGIKERIFNEDFQGLTIYVNKMSIEGQAMEGVMVSDQRDPKEANIIVANRGYLISNPNDLTLTLRLEKGSIHRTSKNLQSYQKLDFLSYGLNLDLDAVLTDTARKKGFGEMGLDELLEQAERLTGTRRNKVQVEFHKKFAFPFASLVFALIGMPLGVQVKRAGRLSGFILGVAVLLIYYVLLSAGEQLAISGFLPAYLSVWMANILLAGLGIYLLICTAHERELKAVLRLAWGMEMVYKRSKGVIRRLAR